MALINIGMVIFGGRVRVPAGARWAGSGTRSGSADWHLALTVVGGYGSVIPWLWQGLDGAPRRFAVLPDQYLTMSEVALPFVALIVVGQTLFAYNLGARWAAVARGHASARRRGGGAGPRRWPARSRGTCSPGC